MDSNFLWLEIKQCKRIKYNAFAHLTLGEGVTFQTVIIGPGIVE